MNSALQNLPRVKPEPAIHDVWTARKRIRDIAQKTPLILSPGLSRLTRSSVYLKLENVQDTGSFKIRGAANKILSLSPEEKQRGVATFSTGNHGMAVARVAQHLGIPAVVCISNKVPEAKMDAIRRLGARLAIAGESQDEAEVHAYRLQREEGLTVVKPFDDFHIIAGQGTIGLEIMEDLPEADLIIAGLSGGGLVSGLGMAVKSCHPQARIVGVSMTAGAVMHESLKLGRPVQLKEHPTLADSLLGGIGLDNDYTFRMVQRYMDASYLIAEEEIARGMAYMLKAHRMVVEGAAAVGIGALLNGTIRPGSHTVLIISGCNTNPDAHIQAVQPFISE